jgi:hypothetical protein
VDNLRLCNHKMWCLTVGRMPVECKFGTAVSDETAGGEGCGRHPPPGVSHESTAHLTAPP